MRAISAMSNGCFNGISDLHTGEGRAMMMQTRREGRLQVKPVTPSLSGAGAELFHVFGWKEEIV